MAILAREALLDRRRHLGHEVERLRVIIVKPAGHPLTFPRFQSPIRTRFAPAREAAQIVTEMLFFIWNTPAWCAL